MAVLHQKIDALNRQDAGLFRELDAIDRLQKSLPDNYDIFQSITWFTSHHIHSLNYQSTCFLRKSISRLCKL